MYAKFYPLFCFSQLKVFKDLPTEGRSNQELCYCPLIKFVKNSVSMCLLWGCTDITRLLYQPTFYRTDERYNMYIVWEFLIFEMNKLNKLLINNEKSQ